MDSPEDLSLCSAGCAALSSNHAVSRVTVAVIQEVTEHSSATNLWVFFFSVVILPSDVFWLGWCTFSPPPPRKRYLETGWDVKAYKSDRCWRQFRPIKSPVVHPKIRNTCFPHTRSALYPSWLFCCGLQSFGDTDSFLLNIMELNGTRIWPCCEQIHAQTILLLHQPAVSLRRGKPPSTWTN